MATVRRDSYFFELVNAGEGFEGGIKRAGITGDEKYQSKEGRAHKVMVAQAFGAV
jgi:hypothetical protein